MEHGRCTRLPGHTAHARYAESKGTPRIWHDANQQMRGERSERWNRMLTRLPLRPLQLAVSLF